MPLFTKSPAADQLKQANEHYRNGEYNEALKALRYGFMNDPDNKKLYKLALQCCENVGKEKEAELFRDAVHHFNDFVPFYELGFFYVEKSHLVLARSFLERAHNLQPDNFSVVSELAFVLAGRFAIEEAIRVLSSVDFGKDFNLSYQY